MYLGYYTVTYNTVNIGGNVYVNHFLGGVLDVGSSVVVIVMLKRMNRKTSLVALFFMCSCFTFLTPIVRKGKFKQWIERASQNLLPRY